MMLVRQIIVAIVAFLSFCNAFTEGGSDHLCEIELEANWNAAPFSLQLIESIASFNESLYEPLLERLFAIEDSTEDEDAQINQLSDKELFEKAMSVVEDGIARKLIEINLANKFNTPRIEAHSKFYKTSVEPVFQSKLVAKCGDANSAWALLDGEIYCTSDDLFAIIASKKSSNDILLPFDRVIGQTDAPIIILYGQYEDPNLQGLFASLWEFSKSGQYRFVWRYTYSDNDRKERLSGYGVDLTLKRVDYIAIDDRNVRKEAHVASEDLSKDTIDPLDIYHDDIQKVYDIKSLELQLTNYVLSQAENGYSAVQKLVSDFPKYAAHISQFADSSDSTNSSLPDLEPGLYLNGRFLSENELETHSLVSALRQEFELVQVFEKFGIESGKDFIQNFASFYANVTNSNGNPKRYNLYTETEGIVFLNDIERDSQYAHLTKNKKLYLNDEIKPGQIPLHKENIHDAIFVLNLSNPQQVHSFLRFAMAILYNKIPQQIGVIPLIQTELDLELARQFWYLCHAKSINRGFQFLQQLANAIELDDEHRAFYDFSSVNFEQIPEDLEDVLELVVELNSKLKRKYHLGSPYVVLNGVFHDLTENCMYHVAGQVYKDGLQLRQVISDGADKGPLKELMYKGSATKRNPLIAPDSLNSYFKPAYVSFKEEPLREQPFVSAIQSSSCSSTPLTLTLIGSLQSKYFLQMLKDALELQKDVECLKLRVINMSSSSESIDPSILEEMPFLSQITSSQSTFVHKAEVIEAAFGLKDFQESESLLILNGRIFRYDLEDMKFLVDYEKKSRLDYLFNSFILKSKMLMNSSSYDLFEEFASNISNQMLTPNLNQESIFTSSSISRAPIDPRHYERSLSYQKYNTNAKLDVVALIIPLQEVSQKVLSVLKLFEGFSSDDLNVCVILEPRGSLETLEINRFYRGVYQNSVAFDGKGALNDNYTALFDSVPERTLFTFDVDVPQSWVVGIKEGDTDLDNVRLSDTGDVKGVYELENILVEGYSRVVGGLAPGGIQVELGDGVFSSDTIIMDNLGYLQLKANPGTWDLKLKQHSKSLDEYSLYYVGQSFSENPMAKQGQDTITIIDLSGVVVYPVLLAQEVVGTSSSKGLFSKWFKRSEKTNTQADINIFTLASGHLYERFLGIMTASVMKHTKHSVKFWLIENYMSPTFRANLPKLAEKYGFSYELITYKWPQWLRSQREKQRTIWGYKILFLDVLFPQDLDKVIFVDADQIVRTDLKELVDLDLEGAPYGYTPMCDSRDEMEGFRFWKQGYWDKVLGQNGLKYHISALYVIDLIKFREMRAGDILRQHYQSLSADPSSLSNLDQDLPNNLQRQIKIFSLPQEWLWCETWCSDESLKTAKTIDLCNNPLTKEPKLDRARRQISEWTTYDDEINVLLSEVSEEPVHDEL